MEKIYSRLMDKIMCDGKSLAHVLDDHKKWLAGEGGARADLHYAELRYADLSGADLPHFQICPEEGSFTAWKKLSDGCIAKAQVPKDAKRTTSLIGRKCRAEYVKTLEIFDKKGNSITSKEGKYDSGTIYTVGVITHPDKYCDDIKIECSHGIHFFMTRKEAEEW